MQNTEKIKFLHIESNNFQDFPFGGTLSFSKQLTGQFRDEIALVGLITDPDDPVGKWFRKDIAGTSFFYFGYGRFKKTSKRPVIPIRLKSWFCLLLYLPRIRVLKIRNVFTQSPHLLFALNIFKWDSICFCFAGISNSISNSRYKSLRFFGNLYERRLFKILKQKVNVILAAADKDAIIEAMARTKNILGEKHIESFPTRYDPEIFFPRDKIFCREMLNIDKKTILLVTTGRLSWVKGWQLLIDSIRELVSFGHENIKLLFIGDGEDKEKIKNYDAYFINNKTIEIVGHIEQDKIPVYLSASDVVVFGSFFEGWPTSMVEAMACGCPIVTTKVSGASEIVIHGKTGYIVNDRNPLLFAKMVEKAFDLKEVTEYSVKNSKKFSVDRIREDLNRLWLSKT